MPIISEKKLKFIKNEIKTEALRLGFSHIGFTTPEKPLHFDSYIEWIENGYAADMDYLKRSDAIAKRKDPKLIMPPCESIIVFAIPYSPSVDKNGGKFPKIANYAIGDDYHHIIPELLHELLDIINFHIDSFQVEFRIYTDTGPVLEKELGQKAGLGWIGKNSCLINPDTGSFFFLAEIFINVPFEPDSIFDNDYCGSCTRCIDNCPTNCILPNRTIDANKCISYLTIENKGIIEYELRPKLDGWIFGCDICQQVCPWNIRFAKQPEMGYFNINEEIASLDIVQELNLSKSEFKAKYRNSPILRAKYEGYLRNLLVGIAFHFEEEFIIPIKNIIKETDNSELQSLAKWVLIQNKISI